jgi:hypothetical protein
VRVVGGCGCRPGVVGHEALGLDAALGVPGQGALRKGNDGRCALVGVQLDIRQARVVIDDRVGILETVAALFVGPR